MLYASSVLCGYGNRTFIGNAKFSPITNSVVVDSCGYRIKQGGFAGVSTTRDNGNAFFDSHTAHTANLNFIVGLWPICCPSGWRC